MRPTIVVCLAIANEQTENLMNDAAFARMKRGAYFVNVSRGNLVDEIALARALDSGHLAGAALDVGRAPDQMPTPAPRAASRRDRYTRTSAAPRPRRSSTRRWKRWRRPPRS